MGMKHLMRSLVDLLGEEYVRAVCGASSFCTDDTVDSLLQRATDPVCFWSEAHTTRLHELLGHVGTRVCTGLSQSATGAGTVAFTDATRIHAAPLSGFGCVRVGEDGRAYFTGKSEHYHVSLGHRFPGFRLLDAARSIGILHPEHNNMRGHITRLLEERLIATAAGIDPTDRETLDAVRASEDPGVLNRVINLQTGSLAAEAALKMMLARCYRMEERLPRPKYHGKRPVVLVMGDYSGGSQANYHGTTLVTQMLRGLWPELTRTTAFGFRLVPVPINDVSAFYRIVSEHDRGDEKIAGFFHEFVLMNYGVIKLSQEFVRGVYEICHEHDIPVCADEIQSGAWSPDGFLFREYGVRPDIVALGKGFPGGEYAASRVMTTPAMDNLDQFGALVTNGQEEIASLAYLIVLETIRENRDFILDVGAYYHHGLNRLAADFPRLIDRVDGLRHMAALFFRSGELADLFAHYLKDRCIDISTHSYKTESLPAALTKLPLVATRDTVDYLIHAMREALESLGEGDT